MPIRLRFDGPPSAPFLVVGEAPKSGGEALVREDLADLAGVQFPDEWRRLFARTNVLPFWPGRNLRGKGDRFPLSIAWAEAAELAKTVLPLWEYTILLGHRVEAAFRLPRRPFFEWRPGVPRHDRPRTSLVVVPHPSKVSRWWNRPDNRALARSFWEQVALRARALV